MQTAARRRTLAQPRSVLALPRSVLALPCRALLLLCCAWLSGCQQAPGVQTVARDMLKAGAGTAAPPARTVVPSKPPVELQSLRIEDERYLGEIARPLETTVDAIRAANQLGDRPLSPGMVLQIHTSRAAIERYLARREQRKADRIAQAEAKRQAKLQAEAEARLAKKLKQRAALARRRGVSEQEIAEAARAALPLKPGEVRTVGNGHVRGVLLPAAVGQ